MNRRFAITARTLLLATGLFGAAVMSAPAAALSHEEWVMAFVRFIDWPAPAPGDPLVICQHPDAPTLALDGKQVRGYTLQVLRAAKPAELDQCNVFAALLASEVNWTPWLAALKGKPVLAVGLGARFCELGGAICLIKDESNGSEKYQLNLDSLSRSGFKVNTQLLRSQPPRAAKGE